MQCMISNCSEEFIDSAIGLAEMTFHVLIHHRSDEVNEKIEGYGDQVSIPSQDTAEDQVVGVTNVD